MHEKNNMPWIVQIGQGRCADFFECIATGVHRIAVIRSGNAHLSKHFIGGFVWQDLHLTRAPFLGDFQQTQFQWASGIAGIA